MIDLTRIRTRAGVNPHYVNVDLDFAEVGHLVLSRTGEIGRAEVTADDEGAVD